MTLTVIGWVSPYDDIYPVVSFTPERKKALAERIRKREYNFTHFDHDMMPYCTPVYSDQVVCKLSKSQWDNVIHEAYKESQIGERRMPMDAISLKPIDGVLYEKDKFIPKEE
jgi:hypothetical protein